MTTTFSYQGQNTKLCKYNSPGVTYQERLSEPNLCLKKIQDFENSNQICSIVARENSDFFARNVHSLLVSFIGLELTIVIGVCTLKIMKQLRPM